MPFSHKIRVGVLRGGPSPEYDVSLKTGGAILSNLPEECEPIDIFISKEGVWHLNGIEKKPYSILKMIDMAVNALHGKYGEDGTVQKLLEDFKIPHTGSKQLSSAFGMNKPAAKNIFSSIGIKTPYSIRVEKDWEGENQLQENKIMTMINESILFPIIIKPVDSGSSIGISMAKNFAGIREALKKSFAHSPRLLVEEFIDGKEATCGVIDDFRGEKFYKMIPVEVLRTKGHFHDYDSKYSQESNKSCWPRYKVPGNFSSEENKMIKNAAAKIHQAMGLRHYSRSDFIIHPRRGLYCLEVNTLPELSHRSAFIKSLEAAGGNIKEFLSHLIDKTLGKK